MARESKIEVDRKSDVVVLDFYRAAAKLIGATTFFVHVAGSAQALHIDLEGDAPDKNLEALLMRNGHLIQEAGTSVERFSISFTRNPLADKSPGYDLLTVQNAQRDHQPVAIPVSTETAIELSGLISSSFSPDAANSAALYRNPAVFRDVMRSHQRMLEKMQETIIAVGDNAAEARANLEREYWDKQAELARETDKKRSGLEKQAATRLAELDKRDQELSERAKALDDRNNTHARRALHTTLKARLAEHSSRFELTDETKGRRKPIHLAVWVSSSVLLGLLIYSSYNLAQSATASNWTALILPAIKPIGLTVALLGLLSWYLRWMNRWFERHADAEFQLKQFELDIDRASWVVETALEWRYAQQVPIPDHLLESISRNLFTRGEKDETADMHPADYLASALLGRAAGVKLKVPGGELEYGSKAFKDAAG